MQVDPLAEKYPGWSPYNYVLNNPVKLYDPDGKWPKWVHNRLITIAFGNGPLNSRPGSIDQRPALKAISAYADEEFGGERYSYRHGMKQEGQSDEEALLERLTSSCRMSMRSLTRTLG